MASNPDSNVAVDGGERLASLRRKGVIGEESIGDYRRLMEAIYKPRLDAIGFDPKVGAQSADSPDQQKLRQSLVALVSSEAHDEAVRAKLKAAAEAYLGGDASALDQAFVGAALSARVEDGGLAAAQEMYERMLASHDETFRPRALRAVTAGATPEVANWVIAQFGDKRLRNPDKMSLLAGLFASHATRDMAYDWLKTNYDSFSSGLGIFSAGRLASLPGDYCSAAKAEEIDTIMRAKVKAAGRGELSFDRMLEGMRNCGVLKDARAAEVAAALKAAE